MQPMYTTAHMKIKIAVVVVVVEIVPFKKNSKINRRNKNT